MKKLIVCAALVGVMLGTPRASWADPKTDFNDAMTRMQEGIPVLQRTLQILAREGPQILDIMQRATQEAARQGGGLDSPPLADGQMPTAEQMAQKIRGLQGMANVMREALPVVGRIKRDLDPAGMQPAYKAPRPPMPGEQWKGPTQQGRVPYTPPWSQTSPSPPMPPQGVPGTTDPELHY